LLSDYKTHKVCDKTPVVMCRLLNWAWKVKPPTPPDNRTVIYVFYVFFLYIFYNKITSEAFATRQADGP